MDGDTGPADLACVVTIDREILAQLLGLPDGAHIDAVQSNVWTPGALDLRIRGFGASTQVGKRLPSARCILGPEQRFWFDSRPSVVWEVDPA